ncbi:serine/threonine/tyrosine-interacting-like protein 1 [Halichoeres trimaculatus]|uniref:serine/threonine/tyrosine-interacting-like protein 1 n=1 Tax=Halichoeres trimaculatus TaxID=147232 RepID=UPI003D9F533F
MAKTVMFEPLELYNLLNQHRSVSRLAEINYLCLIDAREAQDYEVSHIITAINAKVDSEGSFLLPEALEVDCMQHVVIYDGNTSCLEEQGRAVQCAQVFAQVSFHPVKIVRGGFQRFSALYPFLKTEKILYTIIELEGLKTYPVEIISGQLYMGDMKQSTDFTFLDDLKISAVITISESDTLECHPMKLSQAILNVPAAASEGPGLYSHFEKICEFIGSHISTGSRVLIIPRQGGSRCSAVTIAFLMRHFKYTLKEAWRHVLKCKPNMMPNVRILQQLSDWELHTRGAKETEVSELLPQTKEPTA